MVSEKTSKTKQLKWYKLDNAGKIFPAQNSETWSNVFRVSAELKEEVNPEILQKALEITIKRFPCFNVKMKSGFFWHYFVENTNRKPVLLEDINNPCHRIKIKENNGFLFNIYYFGKRIAIDTFHVICDGHASAVFLFTLIGQYYRLKGENIPFNNFVLNTDEPATESEKEDAFLKFATSKATYNRRDKTVYHPKGTKLPAHHVKIISGTIPFEDIHRITKEKNVTITEYIASVLLAVHINKQKLEERKKKEIAIQIPIDLRRTFDTDTLRNFTICLRTKIDPNRGDYSFDDLLRSVSLQLRLANNRNDLNMMITANTKLETNPFLKYTPLVIKDFGIKLGFRLTCEGTTTSLLTNLGLITLPEELGKHIEKCLFMPCSGIKNPARVGVATLNNKLVITFADNHEESDIEREFFTFLIKQGLHVKIESNQ